MIEMPISMPTVEEISHRHLVGILQGYLHGEKWATERRLEGEVYKSHNPEELRLALDSQEFRYLLTISPQRLQHIIEKFLERPMSDSTSFDKR